MGKVKENAKTARTAILALAVTGIIAGGVIAGVVRFRPQRGEEFKLQIGEMSVSEEEYMRAVGELEYDVRTYFLRQYGAEYGEGFWTAEYGGEIPADRMAEEVLGKLKYEHAVYEAAAEKGYIEEAGYEGILRRLSMENARRKESREKGEAVYGLVQYTEELFIKYEMSALQDMYCGDPANSDMAVSEEELLSFYESGEWVVGEDRRTPALEEIRSGLITELRRQKYEKMIELRAAQAQVTADMDELSAYTARKLGER